MVTSTAKSKAEELMNSVNERKKKRKTAADSMLASGTGRNPFLKADGSLINENLDYKTMLNSASTSHTVKAQIEEATGLKRRTGSPRPKRAKQLSAEEYLKYNGVPKPSKKKSSSGKKTSSGGSKTGNAIADTALGYVGVDYVWGGATPDGFDCSGLVQYVAKQNGINVSRTSQAQYKDGKKVSRDELQPGDLVFFEGYTKSSTNPGHVGIYIGDGKYVQAPKTGDKVKVSNMSGRSDYVGARRIG